MNLFADISRHVAWEGRMLPPPNLRHKFLRDPLHIFAVDIKADYESLVSFWICCSRARRDESLVLSVLMQHVTGKVLDKVSSYLIPLHEYHNGRVDYGRTYMARSTMDRFASWPHGENLPDITSD